MDKVEQFEKSGDYYKAIDYAKQVSNLILKEGGSTTTSYIGALLRIVSIYEKINPEFGVIPVLYDQILTILLSPFPKNKNYLILLEIVADYFFKTSGYTKVEKCYNQSLEISKSSFGQNSPEYAKILNRLGALYYKLSKYDKAEEYYSSALKIRKSTLGENDKDYAVTLYNLGELYRMIGKYGDAESFLNQALTIQSKILGEDNEWYGITLISLAELYDDLKNISRAEPLYVQAYNILKKSKMGENHPFLSNCHAGLGNLYKEKSEFIIAIQHYKQALEIRRKFYGENSIDYLSILNNLAVAYLGMKNYSESEKLFQEYLQKIEKLVGKTNHNYAIATKTLGVLYAETGYYEKAAPLFEESLEILKQLFGETHPNIVSILVDYALLCFAIKNYSKGIDFLKQSIEINDRLIEIVFSISSENQRNNYLKQIQLNYEIFLNAVLKYFSENQELSNLAFGLVLKRKALGYEASDAYRFNILMKNYPSLAIKLKELLSIHSDMIRKNIVGFDIEGHEIHKKMLAVMNTKKERLEEEILKLVPNSYFKEFFQGITNKIVLEKIPENNVLIEFVYIHTFDFESKQLKKTKPRYVAFLAEKNNPNIQMIDLDDAEKIDRYVDLFLDSVISEGRSVNTDTSKIQDPHETLISTHYGLELKSKIFDRLSPYLQNKTNLLCAIDGNLSLLPLEGLPFDNSGKFLIDKYNITYLNTSRDLLKQDNSKFTVSNNSIVIAAPNYNLRIPGERGEKKSASYIPRDTDEDEIVFSSLESTKIEGENIAKILGVKPLLCDNVVKKTIKNLFSPKILHIASHGFFLPYKPDKNNKSGKYSSLSIKDHHPMISFDDMTINKKGISRLEKLESPLLRSGIVLSGANSILNDKIPPDEAGDGLLTADDVLSLDLTGTQLVSLSACETGKGDVQIGEGVFGLRRSFMLAGAQTIVMSLWKISDNVTRHLMEIFYDNLQKGNSRSDSLKKAKLELREKFPHVYYWGSFICQGNPQPIL